MSETCKNCNSEITFNFCGNCGQKKAKRIDGKYVKDELQYVLVHTNKGFFYTVKNLMKAPGTTALQFIEGNRVNHYKPILLVFLIAGISAFIANTFIHPAEVMAGINNKYQNQQVFDVNKFNQFIYNYQSFFMVLCLPFVAFFSWISFRKWGHNYFEHIVSNAFMLATSLIFSILLVMPIQYLLRGNPMLFMTIPALISLALMVAVNIWFFIQLYPGKPAGSAILRILLMYGMMFAVFMIATIAWVVYEVVTNPAQFRQ